MDAQKLTELRSELKTLLVRVAKCHQPGAADDDEEYLLDCFMHLKAADYKLTKLEVKCRRVTDEISESDLKVEIERLTAELNRARQGRKMYSEEELNARAVFLIKDAFKSYLSQQIGEISQKPSMETQGWILALGELEKDLNAHLICLPDLNSLVLQPSKIK